MNNGDYTFAVDGRRNRKPNLPAPQDVFTLEMMLTRAARGGLLT